MNTIPELIELERHYKARVRELRDGLRQARRGSGVALDADVGQDGG